MVHMTFNRMGRCPLCGRDEPLERDHIIRRENAKDWTRLIGWECHHRHVSQRQDEIGVTPGLDALIAGPGGVGIYLVLMMEQHGLTAWSDLFRIPENHWAQAYGKPHPSKHRPRRSARVATANPDLQVITREVFDLLADMYRRQADDPRLSQEQKDDCELVGLYLIEASRNAGAYAAYQETIRETFIDDVKFIGRVLDELVHDAPPDWVYEHLVKMLRREALGFLRYLDTARWEHKRKRESEMTGA
jgi:hypothetical protein